MNENELAKAREYYDSTDLSDVLKEAALDTSVQSDAMIGITVRFPKDVLDEVRQMAADRGQRPTAFIRQCMETVVATRRDQRAAR
ncbi:MAG: hypothetical protein QM728_11950 [Gordonia sp. (in: high G+C Gram-positive bacteria)]|uniref:hypothetical protein n=1 Tax=Gordonia sp. (in: high G+C Gram-positive bacteria) TaxID=84139 RepID=UPI0039E2556A